MRLWNRVARVYLSHTVLCWGGGGACGREDVLTRRACVHAGMRACVRTRPDCMLLVHLRGFQPAHGNQAGAALTLAMLDCAEAAVGQLVALATAFDLDGWLLNVECSLPPDRVPQLLQFVRRVCLRGGGALERDRCLRWQYTVLEQGVRV